MDQKDLRDLLNRYIRGECDPREEKLLEDMVLRRPLAGDWQWKSEEEKALIDRYIREGIKRQQAVKARPGKIHRLWYAGTAAAVIFLLAFWGLLAERETSLDSRQLVISETARNAGEGITLKLSDGRTVSLDGYQEGVVSKTDGLIMKSSVPKAGSNTGPAGSGRRSADSSALNTIYIPNGKQFQLTLADGTVVWLNTASSLTYPVVFDANERKVRLEGEAYFEVAHQGGKPFKVIAHDTEIVVTGTSFNISAYRTDNTVTTTLLEGGVNVTHGSQSLQLSPGFQSVSYRDRAEIIKAPADPGSILAWRKGYFIFDGKDISAVMKSVARWYDIEVILAKDIPEQKFGGTFPMSASLEELLADLELLSDVKFAKNGREVKVML